MKDNTLSKKHNDVSQIKCSRHCSLFMAKFTTIGISHKITLFCFLFFVHCQIPNELMLVHGVSEECFFAVTRKCYATNLLYKTKDRQHFQYLTALVVQWKRWLRVLNLAALALCSVSWIFPTQDDYFCDPQIVVLRLVVHCVIYLYICKVLRGKDKG